MKSKRHFQFDYISITMTIGILLYLAVLVFPLLLSFFYSFTNFNLLNATNSFIGVKNYVSMLNDDTFLSTLRFTIETTIIVTLLTNVLGLIIALALNQTGSFYTLLRTVFFIPQVLSSVVIGFIWSGMLNSERGLVNTLLRQIGLIGTDSNIAWLGTPNLATFSVIAVCTWQMVGFCTVVYLAALQGVPQDLKDECSHVINHDVQAVRYHPGDDGHWTSWFDRVPGILRAANGIHSEQGWLCLSHGGDIVYFYSHDFGRIGQVLTQPRG